MALELQVQSAIALVTSEARKKEKSEGRGDQRRVTGRLTDAEGRQLSAVNALVIADPLGVIGDAQVLLPDLQTTGLEAGAMIRIEGKIMVRLSGREFGVITAVVTGERQSPLANYVEWAHAAANGKGKPAEVRAAS